MLICGFILSAGWHGQPSSVGRVCLPAAWPADTRHYFALSGLVVFSALDPRRCRGLFYFAPNGAASECGASSTSKLCLNVPPCGTAYGAVICRRYSILSVFICGFIPFCLRHVLRGWDMLMHPTGGSETSAPATALRPLRGCIQIILSVLICGFIRTGWRADAGRVTLSDRMSAGCLRTFQD